MKLRRYWFEFDAAAGPVPVGMKTGCGVTAWNVEDAKALLLEWLMRDRQAMPCIRRVVEDVDVSTLDAGHLLPNMAPPNRRGIWFPAS